jgi:hypothetical protein
MMRAWKDTLAHTRISKCSNWDSLWSEDNDHPINLGWHLLTCSGFVFDSSMSYLFKCRDEWVVFLEFFGREWSLLRQNPLSCESQRRRISREMQVGILVVTTNAQQNPCRSMSYSLVREWRTWMSIFLQYQDKINEGSRSLEIPWKTSKHL